MQELETRLAEKGIKQDDFRTICSILLTKGILSRAEGGDVLRLYDVAARCEQELSEYLSFAFPVVLTNHLRPPHFRLVPSHHRDVGLDDVDEDLEGRREIRRTVVQALAAALLALRMLYDEQLVEKKMDSLGRISVKLSDFAIFMNATFGISLPSAKMDQRALFMKIKKHGAIEIRLEALGDEDAVIVIRPEILTLVLDQNVRAAQNAFERARQEETESRGAVDEDAGANVILLERGERSSQGSA